MAKRIMSLGKNGYEIMKLYNDGNSTSQIAKQLNISLQAVQSHRTKLINSSLIEPTERGKCKMTDSGEYLFKAIYLKKVRERSK